MVVPHDSVRAKRLPTWCRLPPNRGAGGSTPFLRDGWMTQASRRHRERSGAYYPVPSGYGNYVAKKQHLLRQNGRKMDRALWSHQTEPRGNQKPGLPRSPTKVANANVRILSAAPRRNATRMMWHHIFAVRVSLRFVCYRDLTGQCIWRAVCLETCSHCSRALEETCRPRTGNAPFDPVLDYHATTLRRWWLLRRSLERPALERLVRCRKPPR